MSGFFTAAYRVIAMSSQVFDKNLTPQKNMSDQSQPTIYEKDFLALPLEK